MKGKYDHIDYHKYSNIICLLGIKTVRAVSPQGGI